MDWQHHYFGWSKIIEFLFENSDVDDKISVYLESSIEDTFVQFRNEKQYRLDLYKKNSWIGFAHHNPIDSRKHLRLETIFNEEKNKIFFENCKGIFVLTKEQKKYYSDVPGLRNIPISVLYHPMDNYELNSMYNLESLEFETKMIPIPINTICMIGDHCREFKKYARLKTNLQKVVILESESHWMGPIAKSHRDRELTRNCFRYDYRFPNKEYDEILCNNIQYCELNKPAASNYVLECIVRCSPVFISKNPSVVEYLGENYPFYMPSSGKRFHRYLSDKKLIQETHEYLRNHPFKEKFTIQNFLHDFVNSEVYRNI